MKLKATWYCQKLNHGFTDIELVLAMDREYEISRNGEITQRAARIRLADNTRFAFVLQERALGTTETFDANVAWWSALQDSIKVRDRLMHPN